MDVRRLGPGEARRAHQLFAMMAVAFEEERPSLSDAYVHRLLQRDDLWAVAVIDQDEVVGGLTAHALPMTRAETTELFIYDLAVHPDRQRQGIGRALMSQFLTLAAAAAIEVAFVPAEDEDTHALEFYRAVGGEAAPVTFFTFSR